MIGLPVTGSFSEALRTRILWPLRRGGQISTSRLPGNGALDTTVIVNLLRGKDAALAARFLQGRPADYAVPEMVRAELLLGARNSSHPQENAKQLEKFLKPLKRLPFDGEAAFQWAEIRHALQKKENPSVRMIW